MCMISGMVDRINTPLPYAKDPYFLIFEKYKYVMLHGNGELEL